MIVWSVALSLLWGSNVPAGFKNIQDILQILQLLLIQW